ncbi:hypothetical protein LJC61_00490 [Ruminococcaceae bacterium OttesenSCG-928-A16]|nr:hypothetical protein [Ruminococcaceae bacterium OttesenSCG-928-A16]
MNNLVTLSSTEALHITEGDTVLCGGSQEWFAERWQRQAGCGPTNCAGLLWHLAQTNPQCAALCVHSPSSKANFVSLMQEVWEYVKPGSMGVNTTNIFANGAVAYGRQKGVALQPQTLDIPPLHAGERTYPPVQAFIEKALQSGLPVAFLNLSNGTLKNLESWHWVTLVALRGGEALMYDQAQPHWIDLERWLATSVMGGGFVTVAHGQ